jgi:hypothetical protein
MTTKTKKRKTWRDAGGATVPAVAKPVEKTDELAIELKSKHLAAAIKFRDRAAMIVISDKASDEGALVTIKEGKKGRKQTISDWQIPKRKVAAVADALRDLEKKELEAWDAGLAVLEKRHVEYKRIDDARVAAAEAKERDRLAEIARKNRERELQEQEDAAARLEAASDDLSAREKKFVELVATMRGTSLDGPKTPEYAASQAGFKNADVKGPALLTSPKIAHAIASAVEAKAIREQAEALREEPITVAAPKVESNVGKAAGTRNTKHYSCEGVVDLEKFRAAYLAGDIPAEAMTPNLTFLNKQADALKDGFEQAYPGARLKVKEGVAG